jgi:hypothetical protein
MATFSVGDVVKARPGPADHDDPNELGTVLVAKDGNGDVHVSWATSGVEIWRPDELVLVEKGPA